MKNFLKKLNKTLNQETLPKIDQDEVLLNELIDTQSEVSKLPEFSPVEKVQFEHSIAIDHLYYSSKIEGSNLNDAQRLNEAIHAA